MGAAGTDVGITPTPRPKTNGKIAGRGPGLLT
jgi:hypothetical protein